MAGYLLARVELDPHKQQHKGWVSEFQKLLIEYVLEKSNTYGSDRNYLEPLTVISLNYDRSFEHHMSKDFFAALLDYASYQPEGGVGYSRTLSIRNTLKLNQPHGYMCRLKSGKGPLEVGMLRDLTFSYANSNSEFNRYPGNDKPVGYGESRISDKEIVERMGRHMYVVNEQSESGYARANTSISKAKLVFCLGISPEGINQSHFEFRDDQKVYLSNKESEIPKIKEGYPKTEFISMGGESRLNAGQFVDKFGSIALQKG